MKFENISKLLFFMLLIITTNITLISADTIKMKINGEYITSDVEPQIINGRTLVPIRVVVENLGGQVDWDGKLREAKVTKDSKEIVLKIDSDVIKVKEDNTSNTYIEKQIDQAPIIFETRTLVPIRFVAEELDYLVDWDSVTRTVLINSKQNNDLNEKKSDQEENRIISFEKPMKVKGIYLSEWTLSTTNNIDKWIDIANQKEINTFVINVKNDDGRISFLTSCETANQIGADANAPLKDVEGLVLRLKQNNIFPIARIVAFKDPLLAKQRPDLSIKDSAGNVLHVSGETWVNPYNKEVWDYVVEVAKEAARVGFSEIQFDYIRFATEGQINLADFGTLGKEKNKEQIILEFTRYATDQLRPYGVYVSANVFGTIITSPIDATMVGQNYLEMAKILDYICPMIYPSHYNNGAFGIPYPDLDPYQTIKRALEESTKVLDNIPKGEHRAIVRPWLQDFSAPWISDWQTYGAKQIREQQQATYDVGIGEWIFWNAGNSYSLDGYLAK